MIKETGHIIYVTERPSCKNVKFLEVVNSFGEAGGFETMLKVIADPETSLNHTFYICDILVNCRQMYHKSFVDHYFTRLADEVA